METEPELQLENITISDEAEYTVLLTNRGGKVESGVAALVVVVLLRGVPGCSMDEGVLRNRTAVGGDMEVNTVLKDSSFVS